MAVLSDTTELTEYEYREPTTEIVWVPVKAVEDWQPPEIDFDERSKKGKKGKFLKDWE